MKGKKTLVIDLDETIVHSLFEYNSSAEIVLPITIQGHIFMIYVQIRPKCIEFIKEAAKYFEIVIFTAAKAIYADPLMDLLDPSGIVTKRLYREQCTFYRGFFVKDLNRLGRDLKDVILIDNDPDSYQFNKENGVPIAPWYDDTEDDNLMKLMPVL